MHIGKGKIDFRRITDSWEDDRIGMIVLLAQFEETKRDRFVDAWLSDERSHGFGEDEAKHEPKLT